MAWFSVPVAGYRLVLGAPAKFRSSPHATRTFCPTCSTPLTFTDDAWPDDIDISTCSLDERGAGAPREHTYTASQLGWMHWPTACRVSSAAARRGKRLQSCATAWSAILL